MHDDAMQGKIEGLLVKILDAVIVQVNDSLKINPAGSANGIIHSMRG